MPKPQRTLRGRIATYREEATAFLRRRQEDRKPFVRLYFSGGRGRSLDPESGEAQPLLAVAGALIEAAGD